MRLTLIKDVTCAEGLASLACTVLSEVAAVRVGNGGDGASDASASDSSTVTVAEFEVCDKSARCRVLAVGQDLVRDLRALVGRTCVLLDVMPRYVPSREGDTFRLVAAQHASIVPLPLPQRQQRRSVEKKHRLSDNLIVDMAKQADDILPRDPAAVELDRSFEFNTALCFS
ncbi:hypothetical protein DIPPA_02583 [Diplonema papillatum]|nr:hypothetical protein DIPPA_02583 [Diplonema papillatum]